MVLIKDITTKIKDILNKNPQGMTITQITQKTRITRNTVGRYLENLLVSGQVEMRRFGMKKIYAVSQRVALSLQYSQSPQNWLRAMENSHYYLCKRAISSPGWKRRQ